MRMRSRLAARDESLDVADSAASYLRRKSNQGKGEPPVTPDRPAR
jgi:hypothetical protein